MRPLRGAGGEVGPCAKVEEARERRSLKLSRRGRHDVSGLSRGCMEGPSVGVR